MLGVNAIVYMDYTSTAVRKKTTDEIPTKAAKRQQKRRPRMRVHGASLKKAQPHAGRKLAARR